MKNIVLFASGSGTNVENILFYFNQNPIAKVVSVFCNNPNAKVIERAIKFHVPVVIFSKEDFKNNKVLQKLNECQPDLIVLAGFLWKFPTSIID